MCDCSGNWATSRRRTAWSTSGRIARPSENDRRWCCGWSWRVAVGIRCTWSRRCSTRRPSRTLRWCRSMPFAGESSCFIATSSRRSSGASYGAIARTNAELEATWSLLGLWAMMLHAQVILMEKGVPPKRISVAGVLLGYRSVAARIQEPSRSRGIVGRNGGQGRDRSLPTSEQEQSGLSSQEAGTGGRGPRRSATRRRQKSTLQKRLEINFSQG